VIRFRRLSALLLGAWIGGSILTDVFVTENFNTIDPFLQTPGNVAASAELNRIGRDQERLVLRRNAAEENTWIFINWERVEVALGAALFLTLLFGGPAEKLPLALCVVMVGVVAGQHFLLTPQIADLGRRIDYLPAGDPGSVRFWQLHGIYSGLEIAKIVLGLAFAARLTLRFRPDPKKFVKEYDQSGRAFSQGSFRRG
jgi:hypothetical protein